MSVKAKKMFGQNFLKDDSILHKIIKSMPQNSNRRLVEIGPGLGDLTQRLLQIKNVTAYEIDRDLCLHLKDKFKNEINEGRLAIIEGDVLEFWNAQNSLCQAPYDLIANLPYYIATPIILKALQDKNCKSLRVMIQKEVAQKFSAKVKDKEFCSLAILAQSIAHVELLFDVPPSAFEPEPKVTSSILSIEKIKEYDEIFSSQNEYLAFEKYLKSAFSAPRKVLTKNLSSFYDKDEITNALKELDLNMQTRPHEIDTAKHHHLFKKITKVNENYGRESTKSNQ